MSPSKSAAADPETSAPIAPPVAAIVDAQRGAADALLAEIASDLERRGVRVRGVIQEQTGEGKAGTFLRDLGSGRRHALFQDLGAGAASCRVDPAALAAASAALQRAVAERADLVLANRFGEYEAQDRGLAGPMLSVFGAGIPLLTVVRDAYLPAWRRFTDGLAAELPASRAALEAWLAGCRVFDGSRAPGRART